MGWAFGPPTLVISSLHASQLVPGLALAADQAAPHALWAATEAGLYRSADGGDSWRLAAAFDGLSVLAVAADPRDSAKLLAAVGENTFPVLWMSADHGESWVETSPLLTQSLPLYINSPRFTFDPARPGTVYLFFPPLGAYSDYLWALSRSSDRGESWSPSWQTGQPGLPSPLCGNVIRPDLVFDPLDPQEPSILYAGTADQGIFRIDLNE